MFRIGLTGNIASGKSTVARLFQEWGAELIDADAIVHELERPGTPVFRAIVDRFGAGAVAPDGSLDRAALRTIVFDDRAALAALNAIVHPAVRAERERRVADALDRGVGILVEDIPLLFEVMDPALFDAVVLVDAPIATRRARLERARGLDRSTAESMINSQMPAAEKRSRATYVIDNDGSFDELERRAREVWKAFNQAS